MESFDFIIIGAGIIGLSIAYALKIRYPDASIAILEKEPEIAQHASGRNSGVLHAGFYYTQDSLKAKFCVEGNRRMQRFCEEYGLSINRCQKLVVAQNAMELPGLDELYQRGKRNGVTLRLLDAKEARDIEPNVKTYEQALLSPTTASVNPSQICFQLKTLLKEQGVHFYLNTRVERLQERSLKTITQGRFAFGHLINAAGLYADRLAQQLGLAKSYVLLPFKGVYLKKRGDKQSVRTHIYPVPNLRNPFLGVHFTKTVEGDIKIGPSAIPALWREHYQGLQNFKFNELVESLYYQAKLWCSNSFGFRQLAWREIKNYSRHHFIAKARALVQSLSSEFNRMPAGIRAQLYDKQKGVLVNDFVLEHTAHSTHVLNAVSPAFTCGLVFGEYVVEQIERSG